MNTIKVICIFSWIFFAVYIVVNVGLGSHIGVKELSDRNQHLPKEEYMKVMEEHQNHPITVLRNYMIPIWNHNDLIYPISLLFIAGSTILYIREKKKNEI